MEKKWLVTFAYSGCGKREFFTKEFTVLHPSQTIDTEIKTYMDAENRGEPKSERIRYWSKIVVTAPSSLTDKK